MKASLTQKLIYEVNSRLDLLDLMQNKFKTNFGKFCPLKAMKKVFSMIKGNYPESLKCVEIIF